MEKRQRREIHHGESFYKERLGEKEQMVREENPGLKMLIAVQAPAILSVVFTS